jgi:hypothetical protein
MRCRLAAGTVGLGCAGLLLLGMVTPAGARMGAQDIAADCEQSAMDAPAPGGLKITTQIPDGAKVAPGDDIAIRLTWDPKDWSGDQLDAALACVEVKGGLDPDLSAGERPSANDGVFEYVLHVPENIKPGCDICVQGFLTGLAGDGSPMQVSSERPCFMSGPPAAPAPPPGAARSTPPPPAPAAATPPPAVRAPTEVGGITASQPAPAPLAAPAATPGPALVSEAELPRTGSPVTGLATAGGGLSLTFGGLAVMGGAGRRNRRRNRH